MFVMMWKNKIHTEILKYKLAWGLFVYLSIYLFIVLGIELRTSRTLGNYSATKLCTHPSLTTFLPSCLGWSWTCDPSAIASWVTGSTGLCHQAWWHKVFRQKHDIIKKNFQYIGFGVKAGFKTLILQKVPSRLTRVYLRLVMAALFLSSRSRKQAKCWPPPSWAGT